MYRYFIVLAWKVKYQIPMKENNEREQYKIPMRENNTILQWERTIQNTNEREQYEIPMRENKDVYIRPWREQYKITIWMDKTTSLKHGNQSK